MFETMTIAMALICVATTINAAETEYKGIGDNGPTKLSEQDTTQLAHTTTDFKRLGVKWVRLDFDWKDIEPAPNDYKLEGFDKTVKALADAGIHVLGVIAYTPAWANGNKPSKFYPPDRSGDYAKFSSYLATRYAPMGVHAWEIWNEPNVGQFWGQAPDPIAYTALLQAAFKAIHEADPKAIVVTGGLAQPKNSATTITALDFLQAMFKSGAHGYFDAVGNHPYSSPRMPSDPGSNWQKIFGTSPSFVSIMSANGDADKRIWLTEYGAPTNGISFYSQKIVISEEEQARMVEDAYKLVMRSSWAGPLFWYEYQDLCLPDATKSAECYYGLVRHDGTAKPSYTAYGSALGG